MYPTENNLGVEVMSELGNEVPEDDDDDGDDDDVEDEGQTLSNREAHAPNDYSPQSQPGSSSLFAVISSYPNVAMLEFRIATVRENIWTR